MLRSGISRKNYKLFNAKFCSADPVARAAPRGRAISDPSPYGRKCWAQMALGSHRSVSFIFRRHRSHPHWLELVIRALVIIEM